MKHALLCIFLNASLLSFSQDLAEVKVKYNGSVTRVVYPALIKHLTKENSYKLVYPNKLTYYQSLYQMSSEGLTFPYSDIIIKAKRNSDNPEIYIVIESPGMTNLALKGTRKTPNGFVIDYSYNLSWKLLIQDNKGTTAHTIPVYTEADPFEVSYLKNFAAYNTMGYNPLYFSTEKEATDFQTSAKDIGKHIEKYAVLMANRDMAKVITALYNDYSEKKFLQWGDISDAKGVAEYEELSTATAQIKQSYKLMDDDKWQEAIASLQSARKVFDKYADNTKLTVPVKSMVLYNLAWTAIFTGDKQKSLKLYRMQSSKSNWYAGAGWDVIKGIADHEAYRDKIRKHLTK